MRATATVRFTVQLGLAGATISPNASVAETAAALTAEARRQVQTRFGAEALFVEADILNVQLDLTPDAPPPSTAPLAVDAPAEQPATADPQAAL